MIFPNISILARASDKTDLILLEAQLIKKHKLNIDIQTDDFNRTLKPILGVGFTIHFL